MPFTINNGVRIYWEEQGTGEPLLLIMGLGGTLRHWWRILPGLAETYRVVSLDNRGVGESDMSPAPYSIIEMMQDAKTVMEAANIESANILGFSMGGMIAQEFVLNFPEKVRKLILAATFCGSTEAVWAQPGVQKNLLGGGAQTAEEAFWVMTPYIYDKSTSRSRIEEDLAAREGRFSSRESFMGQLQAMIAWQGTHSRLHQIKVPTMILHGVNDHLIPCENGRILANQIPNAKLVELEQTSHIFMTDQTERVLEEILSFLEN